MKLFIFFILAVQTLIAQEQPELLSETHNANIAKSKKMMEALNADIERFLACKLALLQDSDAIVKDGEQWKDEMQDYEKLKKQIEKVQSLFAQFVDEMVHFTLLSHDHSNYATRLQSKIVLGMTKWYVKTLRENVLHLYLDSSASN